MKKNVKRYAAFFMGITLAVTLLNGCSPANDKTQDNNSNTAGEKVTSTLPDVSQYSKTKVFTIGDSEVMLDEVMWYVYLMEDEFREDAKQYKKDHNSSYYDVIIDKDNNTTVADKVRQEIIDQISYYEIMSAQAVDSGKYTFEDEKTLEEKAKEKFESVDKDVAEKCGLTQKSYENILKKWTYTDLLYSDITKLYDIDDEVKKVIKEKYKDEELRQYDTEYLFVSYYDGSNKLSDDEIEKRKKELEKIAGNVKEDNDMSLLASGNVTYGNTNFVNNDSDSTSTEYKNAAMKLENKAVSDIVETNEGCYIIRMKDNNSKEYYNYIYDSADKSYRSQKFQEEYQNIEGNYPIKIDEDIWNAIDIGNMTS